MKARHTIAVSILTGLFVSAPGFAEQQTYEVKNGDNLYKIGKLFSTTPGELKKLNDLKDDRIEVGWILKVSAEQAEAPATQDSVKTAADADINGQPQIQQVQQTQEETRRYTVRQGDTISGIAQSFNLGVKDITAANRLANSNKLSVGQVLVIPAENKTFSETQAAVASTQTVNKADLNPPANLDARERLVEAGFNLLGVRYRYGGTSEKTGLDCSALVKNLFEKLGFTLPRSSREQYKEGEKVAKEDLQKGDLVFFSSGGKTPTHVGIYIGDNQFLHAASKAKKVIISDLSKTWYDFRYLGARRILELWREDTKMPSGEATQEASPVSVHSDNAPPGEFASSAASMEDP